MPEEREEIKEKAKTIEAIHQEYLRELDKLRKRQDQIIADFTKELENKKVAAKKGWFRRFLDKILK